MTEIEELLREAKETLEAATSNSLLSVDRRAWDERRDRIVRDIDALLAR